MRKSILICGLMVCVAGLLMACSEETETVDETTTTTTEEVTTTTQDEGETLDYVTTESGLKYFDHVIGDGEEAVAGMTVDMHYTGWLQEGGLGVKGKKFDSSHDRQATFPVTLGAGRVIKGWDEGLLGMEVGGKRTLVIPPELGYGARDVGNGLIPANSTLIFDVEFVSVSGK